MKAIEKYPLSESEKSALVKASVLSEVLILVGALILICITVGAATGDWLYAFLHGWWDSLVWALGPHNTVDAIVPPAGATGAIGAVTTMEATSAFDAPTVVVAPESAPLGDYLLHALLYGVLFGLVLFAILIVMGSLGKRFSKSYQKALRELRQGLTGELVRLPMSTVVPCMMLAGFAEELGFRFVFLNLMIALFGLFLPGLAAQIVALVVVSIAFWLVHEQYRDPFSSSVAICGGLLLGASYLITGWILVPMIAHAVYNISEIAYEQHLMIKEKDYFFGKVPTDLVTRLNQTLPDDGQDDDSLNKN